MTPVRQTIFGDKVGNCLQAALASLFDLPLDEVPHVVIHDDWWSRLQAWLRPKGLCCVYVERPCDQPGYYIAVGKSPRGDFHHVVVMHGAELAHDPHPDGTGLLRQTGEYVFGRVFMPEAAA